MHTRRVSYIGIVVIYGKKLLTESEGSNRVAPLAIDVRVHSSERSALSNKSVRCAVFLRIEGPGVEGKCAWANP